ncbi:hypothetical protein BT63DRAFT_449818 [Microthyrium microscopicum]|uniref:F-box domain-containing protein n=1 Tax=Microthyrium microscopicum TaxID=703497 RepID=A0A6A6USU2_9PEZI|nr:hypothetical protein BT63DRAFT_449818 [Microthyrium microscopicum]
MVQFLDLPGEIRNKIYGEYFRTHELWNSRYWVNVVCNDNPWGHRGAGLEEFMPCTLFLINKQIREESRSLWFTTILPNDARFQFDAPSEYTDFLKRIPKEYHHHVHGKITYWIDTVVDDDDVSDDEAELDSDDEDYERPDEIYGYQRIDWKRPMKKSIAFMRDCVEKMDDDQYEINVFPKRVSDIDEQTLEPDYKALDDDMDEWNFHLNCEAGWGLELQLYPDNDERGLHFMLEGNLAKFPFMEEFLDLGFEEKDLNFDSSFPPNALPRYTTK